MGRLVAQAASKNIKPVTLELGGKSPAIVWKDVDITEVSFVQRQVHFEAIKVVRLRACKICRYSIAIWS